MYRNPEGYADPTAGKAIRNASRKKRGKKMEREGMSLGRARAIFNDINRPGLTDIERGEAIKVVMEMETHNSVTKAAMLQVIRCLWNMVFTEGDDGK